MELKATMPGKRLAQHPYNRVVILNAGIKVSGDCYRYLVPSSQLLTIHCKRGLVWGELEFVLPDEKVVRLCGIEWGGTQRFYYHLNAHWWWWSGEVNEIASDTLRQQLDLIVTRTGGNKRLTREQTFGMRQQIRQTLSALPLPVNRLEEFDNCREAQHRCQARLKDTEGTRLQRNQAYTEATLTEYADSFHQAEFSPLNSAQARVVVSGKHSLLVLAGAGSGEASALVACAGWSSAHDEAFPKQISLLTLDHKVTEEMDEHIRERLHIEGTIARTFYALAPHIIQQGSKKVPIVSKLENDAAVRHELFIAERRK